MNLRADHDLQSGKTSCKHVSLTKSNTNSEESELMKPSPVSLIERRDFLKLAGAATVGGLTHNAFAAPTRRISIIVDAENPIVYSRQVMRAVGELRKGLVSKGITCETVQSADQAKGSDMCIVVAGAGSSLAQAHSSAAALTEVESVCLTPGKIGQTPAIFVSAIDPLGFIYGVYELTEQVQFNADPMLRCTQSAPLKKSLLTRCAA
jgi:hypothetical protein